VGVLKKGETLPNEKKDKKEKPSATWFQPNKRKVEVAAAIQSKPDGDQICSKWTSRPCNKMIKKKVEGEINGGMEGAKW